MTEFVPEHITLAVKHGAAFLDEKEPDWERRLDLESLSIRDECKCVLGQLHGDFGDGLYAVGLDIDNEGPYIDLGFDRPSSSGYMQEARQLTEAWRREVRSRTGDSK